MRKKGKTVFAGRYYGQRQAGAPLEDAPAGRPDVVICRRLVDYAPGQLPAAAARGTCSRCTAAIAYNPAGPHQDRPKVCMQCAGIAPLPL